MDTTRLLKAKVVTSAQGNNSTNSPGALDSSEEGQKFVVLLLIYFCVCFMILAVAILFRLFVRRKKVSADGKTGGEIVEHIGLFASARWHPLYRGPAAMFFMLSTIVPTMVLLICFLLGLFLSVVEEWQPILGVEYMLSSVLGLQASLTTASPTSLFGIIADYFASIWAMLLTTTAMGLAAGMCMIGRMTDAMPQNACGFFVYLLGLIPIILSMMTAITAGVLATIEGWEYREGFYFMIGSICGLANPLTQVTPVTAAGAFFEVLCVSVEICLGGAVIGIVGAHPLATRFIMLVEGKDEENGDETSMAIGTLRQIALKSRDTVDLSPSNLKNLDEQGDDDAADALRGAKEALTLLKENDALRCRVQALETQVQAADETVRKSDALAQNLQSQLIDLEARIWMTPDEDSGNMTVRI